MSNPIRLCLALHNHQPVGNFDHVFEQSYAESYRPFLDVFEDYHHLKISLHTSGPLMEWLDEKHPEYLERLSRLVADGRIEIIGGAYYEPILTMIPPRDRVGQISTFSRWLESRFAADIRGMWVPERVWEQGLTSDIGSAGITYTILDDFHFRNAGLSEDSLFGYYVTEDNGELIKIFPGSERLRYLIPFQDAHETIQYLRGIADQHENAVLVFGDDGEKFGSWPGTKEHVYDHGWLRQFFDALTENREWLWTSTLSDVIDSVAPVGKIYLPEGSYREMTEWALPTQRQQQYEDLSHDLAHDERWPRIQQFVRGGYWRNFKIKYPEADEMYARMMMVSRRLDDAFRLGGDQARLEDAQRELYRGQCNCSYWHGAFGGIYLPHLRNAVYNHLIAADNILDEIEGRPSNWVSAAIDDFDLDAHKEVSLVNDRLMCLFAPSRGGMMYELDLRPICHNLLSTLNRRPESYHRKVQAGPAQDSGDLASIHDVVVFKQEGLDQRLHYDVNPRKSLIDHFYRGDVSLQSIADGTAVELGSFVHQRYDARVRRNPDRIQIMQHCDGHVDGHPLRITKGVTLESGSSTLEIAYMLEGVPQDQPLHFSVEFNFAGLPSGADDRYFLAANGHRLGQLGTRLDLAEGQEIALVDEWLGVDVQLSTDCTTHLWTYPVETVSNSEGGFELVHQSVVVQPHWYVEGDEEGRWIVTMKLLLDTSMAEQRMQQALETVAS